MDSNDLRQIRCKRCGSLKSIHMFYVKNRNSNGKTGICKACKLNTEKARKRGLPSGDLKNKSRKSYLKIVYGMTPEQYAQLLESQGGGCAICGNRENFRGNQKMHHVDHDHVAGRVRGILCAKCNSGLGFFDDDETKLTKAIVYLKQQG